MSLSVAAVLAESATRRPAHPALVFDEQSVTYRELWMTARRYAAALHACGVAPGDRVALLLRNSPEFPPVFFGVLAVGAVAVPVNALLKAEEIAYVLRDSGVVALVCDGALLGEGAPAAAEAGVPVLTVGTAHEGGRALDELAARTEPLAHYEARDSGDPALILYTSGTTGRPKGAVLTHLNIIMNVQVTMESPFDFRPDDVLLEPLPLFHTFGLVCGMTTCFRAGATMVLMQRFAADRALELLARHCCSVFMGVPTMYIALLEAGRHTGVDSLSLDRAYSGGSALPVAVLEEFEKTFDCHIYEGYGLTETAPVVAYNQKAWPRRPGTVGRPVWGVDVEIARADVEGRIELLPAGEVGEVVVRGHNVMAGYLGRPEATAEVVVDGWFRTGDLGAKDPDGYLSIVDRKKDVVLRGGYNVYPREVEDVLMRHPAVLQTAVLGLPDPVQGEEVCAVVVPAAGASPSPDLGTELVAWCRARLAAYKYPRTVRFVEALPTGPSGKVLKRELVGDLDRAGSGT